MTIANLVWKITFLQGIIAYNTCVRNGRLYYKRLSNNKLINFTEVANHINGDMLTENPVCATSAFGRPRVIPGRWKAATAAQIEEIKNSPIST